MARTLVAAIAGSALAALSACGGSGTAGSSSGNQSSSSAAQGRAVTIVAKDFSFDTPTISAAPGEIITVTLNNQGQKEHSFTTTSGPTAEAEAEGGASKSVTFTLPQSGNVSFHCKYHPTAMTGSIVIGGAGGAAAPTPAAPTPTPGGYGY